MNGVGFIITEIWAYLAEHGDGDEGVLGVNIHGRMVPLIAADRRRLDELRPHAEMAAGHSGLPVKLVKFTNRIDVESIDP